LQGEAVRSQSEEVCMGLDKNIIHPDKGANIAKKLERLQVSGVNEVAHPNLLPSPAIPNEQSQQLQLNSYKMCSAHVHRVQLI